MTKVPFSIAYRPQIESGEYKVVTREDRPVEIKIWDLKGDFPVVGIYYDDKNHRDTAVQVTAEGRCSIKPDDDYCDDFFIVTEESEYLTHSVTKTSDQEAASEDLEVEFNRFLDEVEGVPRMWHSEEQMEWAMDIARHFADWLKQQIMKGAVKKRIETNFLRAYLCLYVDELGFEPGDEVKVIIIKEDKK